MIEVLVSTINSNQNLVEKMNIQTNVTVINQNSSDQFGHFKFKISSGICKWYNFSNEKGIGISRNNALMRAEGEILVIADDDEVFVHNYKNVIMDAYKKYPDADMIIFDVDIFQDGKVFNRVNKDGRVRLWNSLRYGAVTFTFRRSSILRQRIFFSLLFGGGTSHGSGEDSLFIRDVLKSGLKVYSVKEKVATVYNDGSSWFTGYNKKFFFDKGVLFKSLFPKLYLLYGLYFLLKNRKKMLTELSFFEAFKSMMSGSKKKWRE